METSQELDKLAVALSKAQSEMQNAPKNATNPYYKSKYADFASVIDATKKPLADNGLSITQLLNSNDSGVIITTMLLHSSGQWIRDSLTLKPVKNDPQGMGSAITYGRRYSYAAIIGQTSEDDDGNAASNTDEKDTKVHVEGTTVIEFNPMKSTVDFGKYKGLLWAEVPPDYVDWLTKNSTNGNQKKAIATVEWRRGHEEQTKNEPSVIDSMFPPEKADESKPEEKETIATMPFLVKELDTCKSLEDLEKWSASNKGVIAMLDEKEKTQLRKLYNAIKKGFSAEGKTK